MTEIELLSEILEQLKTQSSPSVSGFGNPPKTRYIYANRQYPDCLWYFWDGGKNVHEPIADHAITGIIDKIEIETKGYRGKPDPKLNVYIKADRSYVVQSGLDTLFAKGLIFTLAKLPIEAFKRPIMVAVEAGEDDKVLFSRVYNPATGQLVFAPYTDSAVWSDVISKAIGKVTQAHAN